MSPPAKWWRRTTGAAPFRASLRSGKSVTARFGPDILQADGALNRAELRQRVFQDVPASTAFADERRWLERTLHPRINRLIADGLAAARSPYAILVNPLMRNRDPRANRILVVDVPEGIQIERTMARSTTWMRRTPARSSRANSRGIRDSTSPTT